MTANHHHGHWVRIRKTHIKDNDEGESFLFAIACLIPLLIVLLAPAWYAILFLVAVWF
jgi:hypothetical protein